MHQRARAYTRDADIHRLRQRMRVGRVQSYVPHPANPVHEFFPEALLFASLFITLSRREFCCRSETDDAWNVESARAEAAFMAASVDERRDLRPCPATPHVQRPDAFG